MNFIQRFMQGRRGTDNLNLALVIASIVCTFISSLVGWFASNTVTTLIYMMLQFVGTALLVLAIYRMFSRNIPARERENAAYMHKLNGVRAYFRRDRKTYSYFKCPACKAQLRVPKGKGTIIVTCPKCRHETKTKS